MSYVQQLEDTKTTYPFNKWRQMFFPDPDDEESGGMEQYTQENCDSARDIFDNLISGLISIGQSAPENEKVELFKKAVEALNVLNNNEEGLIETGEREDLCELIDQITIAAGLNPSDYSDGEGISDQWRDW